MENSNQSADAMALFLQRSIEQSLPISKSDLELASAYEVEWRGYPVSEILKLRVIEALSYSGLSEELFASLDNLISTNPVFVEDAIDSVLGISIDQGELSQSVILSNFIQRYKLFEMISQENLVELSNILLAHGLLISASQFSFFVLSEEEKEKIKFELALLARENDDIRSVNYSLIGDELRERALNYFFNSGQLSEVSSELLEGSHDGFKFRRDFAAGRWLETEDQSLESRISTAISASASISVSEKPLTSAQRTISESQISRDLIEQALRE